MPTFHAIPTLIPSICFFISFTLTTALHIFKYVKLKRTIYLYLFIFSLLRTFLFISRIIWSPNPDSMVLGIISNVLLLGGFFVILEALCTLLLDWLLLLVETKTETGTLPNYELYLINLLKLVSPVFSIIGAIGEIFGIPGLHNDLAPSFLQASSLGFLCLIIVYIIMVAYFALKYGDNAVGKQLKALVLFISASLLLIELVYRTIVSFSHEPSSIYHYEWVYYVFECIPEISLLLILGEVILGEWFYDVEDDNKLKRARQLAKLHSKGIFSACVLSKNREEKEEKNEESRVNSTSSNNSNIIIINIINDDDNNKSNTKNSTNSSTV